MGWRSTERERRGRGIKIEKAIERERGRWRDSEIGLI